MRRLVLIILLSATFTVYGQEFSIDRFDGYLGTAYSYFMVEKMDSSLIFIDKTIKLDSSCAELYLIRGFFKLWEPYLYEESAIRDFDTYITKLAIGNNQLCIINDSLTKSLTQSIINYRTPGELGALSLSNSPLGILYGVIAYIKDDKTSACEFWLQVKNEGDKNIDFLIFKYCQK